MVVKGKKPGHSEVAGQDARHPGWAGRAFRRLWRVGQDLKDCGEGPADEQKTQEEVSRRGRMLWAKAKGRERLGRQDRTQRTENLAPERCWAGTRTAPGGPQPWSLTRLNSHHATGGVWQVFAFKMPTETSRRPGREWPLVSTRRVLHLH